MRSFVNLPLDTVQVWVRLADCIPTESPIIDPEYLRKHFGEEGLKRAGIETMCPSMNCAEYYPQFLKDMEQMEKDHGVRAPQDSIFLHPNGMIGDGNYRYHWLRWAGIEFVPINLNYLICNNSEVWRSIYNYDGVNMAGKVPTTFAPPRHINPQHGVDNWWELEARYFLNHTILNGPPPPEFNLSYEECKRRLEI